MTTATATRKTTTLPKGCIDIDDLPFEVASVLAERVASFLNPSYGHLSIEVVEVNGQHTGFHVIDTHYYYGDKKSQSVLMSTSLKAKPICMKEVGTGLRRMGWEVWMKKPKGWDMVTKVI
jgi:hypothetical protein